jgi:uncharacterized protein (AIM24 family)
MSQLLPRLISSKYRSLLIRCIVADDLVLLSRLVFSLFRIYVSFKLFISFMRCCCAGLGMVRQKIKGTGTVFLESTGTIVQKVLQPGETVLVDTNCVLAFAGTCKLDLRRAGGIVGMMGGGEGIFNTTLTGPGLVIMVSMNQTVFREALAAQKLYRR